MTQAVAITGIGIIASPGVGIAKNLEGLRAGMDGLGLAEYPDLPLAANHPTGIVQADLPKLPRNAALALIACEEACAMAGLTPAELREAGLAIGTSTGGMRESEVAYHREVEGDQMDRVYLGQQAHNVSEALCRRFHIHGPVATHTVACTSSACALIEAIEWIRHGVVDRVIAVGSDCNTRLTMAGFKSLQVVDPEGCRPLTQERKGMSLGEAGAALILENPQKAKERGASILASACGWGLYADGYHPTAPDPEAVHLRRAIEESLDEAGAEAADVDYICAHGTGTRDNDEVEATAFNALFGSTPCASWKRTYGHTMGAAGAVEAVGSVLAILHGESFPSAGSSLGTPIEGLDVITNLRKNSPKMVLSTNLAFGGINTALLFGEPARCD